MTPLLSGVHEGTALDEEQDILEDRGVDMTDCKRCSEQCQRGEAFSVRGLDHSTSRNQVFGVRSGYGVRGSGGLISELSCLAILSVCDPFVYMSLYDVLYSIEKSSRAPL